MSRIYHHTTYTYPNSYGLYEIFIQYRKSLLRRLLGLWYKTELWYSDDSCDWYKASNGKAAKEWKLFELYLIKKYHENKDIKIKHQTRHEVDIDD